MFDTCDLPSRYTYSHSSRHRIGIPGNAGQSAPHLGNPEAELLLRVVSEVEISIKNALGKLNLPKNDLAAVCASAGILTYPLRQRHTDRLFDLPMHHKHPFDRMIIATALPDGLPVISRDVQFRRYEGLRVIWR